MLNAHFCAGDGRVNENIALTAVHQIFHSEHDRLVGDIKNDADDDTSATASPRWRSGSCPTGRSRGWNYGERLFQAARFVTEMEYQHLVFEEFARKVAAGDPAVPPLPHRTSTRRSRPSSPMRSTGSGTRCWTTTVARQNADRQRGHRTDNSLPLLDGVPEPAGVLQRAAAGTLHAGAGGGRDLHGLVRPGRQRDRRVRDRDPAQQPARSAARPADDQHDARP